MEKKNNQMERTCLELLNHLSNQQTPEPEPIIMMQNKPMLIEMIEEVAESTGEEIEEERKRIE